MYKVNTLLRSHKLKKERLSVSYRPETNDSGGVFEERGERDSLGGGSFFFIYFYF